MDSRNLTAPSESQIDWNAARSFLTAAVRHRLRGRPLEETEELVSEAIVRLYRVSLRERVLNPEALMNRLADCVVADYFRRESRWRRCFESLSAKALQVADLGGRPDWCYGEPEERLVLMALEFFDRSGTSCRELAREVIGRSRRTWREVAASLGRTEAAVRQQWSRCLKDLRKAAAESEGLLRAWAELSARP